jgi:hypothetical protein
MLNIMLSVIRRIFSSIAIRAKMLFNPAWWKTTVFIGIQRFFIKLFDVKPRDKKDYYPLFAWLVSKRLAFALVMVVGVVSIYYIVAMSPISHKNDAGADALPAYKYNSIPLKFAQGDVRIKAKPGYVAYEGAVDKGVVVGYGKLFARSGALVYEGSFTKNMYNGKGKLYYPDGVLHYEGSFTDNIFEGEGKLYGVSGGIAYAGEFLAGIYNGAGLLYNAGGQPIFAGNFRQGEIVYSEFSGLATNEAALLYLGDSDVYLGADGSYCVDMKEIGAVYSADGGLDTLAAEWTIGSVTVAKQNLVLGGRTLSTIAELTAFFGAPDYFGYTSADLETCVALQNVPNSPFGKPDIVYTAALNDVFDVRE